MSQTPAVPVHKKCSTCSSIKEIELFTKDSRRPDGRTGVCKECSNKSSNKAYYKKRDKYLAQNKVRSNMHRKNNLEYIKSITNLTCSNCGFSHTTTAPFDWHHLNPEEKDIEIGNLMRRATQDKLKEEISKCIFLCKNCHALEHERLREEESI